jgi:hypothetical protein
MRRHSVNGHHLHADGLRWSPEQWLIMAVLLQALREAHSRDLRVRWAAEDFLINADHLWLLLHLTPPNQRVHVRIYASSNKYRP